MKFWFSQSANPLEYSGFLLYDDSWGKLVAINLQLNAAHGNGPQALFLPQSVIGFSNVLLTDGKKFGWDYDWTGRPYVLYNGVRLVNTPQPPWHSYYIELGYNTAHGAMNVPYYAHRVVDPDSAQLPSGILPFHVVKLGSLCMATKRHVPLGPANSSPEQLRMAILQAISDLSVIREVLRNEPPKRRI